MREREREREEMERAKEMSLFNMIRRKLDTRLLNKYREEKQCVYLTSYERYHVIGITTLLK